MDHNTDFAKWYYAHMPKNKMSRFEAYSFQRNYMGGEEFGDEKSGRIKSIFLEELKKRNRVWQSSGITGVYLVEENQEVENVFKRGGVKENPIKTKLRVGHEEISAVNFDVLIEFEHNPDEIKKDWNNYNRLKEDIWRSVSQKMMEEFSTLTPISWGAGPPQPIFPPVYEKPLINDDTFKTLSRKTKEIFGYISVLTPRGKEEYVKNFIPPEIEESGAIKNYFKVGEPDSEKGEVLIEVDITKLDGYGSSKLKDVIRKFELNMFSNFMANQVGEEYEFCPTGFL